MMTAKTLPILYSFRRCPYAMRARLALYHAKINHEHREITLKNKPAEMIQASAKGTVPVMVQPDGQVLEESLDIMLWALNIPSPPSADSQFIQENDTTFKHALDRYKYPGRYDEIADANYRQICEKFLIKLENHPSIFQDKTRISLLDMALFPFIRQFTMVDPEWFASQPYPNIQAWLEFISSTELFEQVMQKHPIWQPSDAPIKITF